LLGTGESGKSTIAKQLKIMHLDGFSKEERDMYRVIIHSNIVESTTTLIQKTESYGFEISSDMLPIVEKFKNTTELASFTDPDTARKVAALWKDPAIQKTYDLRAEYQLPGSVDYMLHHAERLLTPSSEVFDEDILHCRLQTRGIVEIEFQLDDTQFKVVDVGGQRGERKKWFHCFASVTAVIFCVALNEYDEKLFEDNQVNRMTEALLLFKEVCNNKFFNDPKDPTSMILFLNKNDLFKEKIKKVPLKKLFPDYKGGGDPVLGAEFILRKFLAQSSQPNKLIFSHVTCATDTENVRVVFNAVRSSILNRSLEEAQIL
jgi:GTPase SAR1 family protein